MGSSSPENAKSRHQESRDPGGFWENTWVQIGFHMAYHWVNMEYHII